MLNDARTVFRQLLEKYTPERKEEQQKVIALGGLSIIGTERHESRRIDNQLRGRAGRQGDVGESKFFISLEDDLMRRFGGEKIQGIMDRFGMQEEALAAGMLSRRIEGAQKKVESVNFEIRKNVLQYDNVMNKQREVIYEQRRRVLFGDNIREYIMEMMEDLVTTTVEPIVIASKFPEEWDFDTLNENLREITPLFEGISYTDEEKTELTDEKLKEDVLQIFRGLYEKKEAEVGEEHMRNAEKMILLRVVDNRWMDQIEAMDELRQGIGLRQLGHINPVNAYASEGFDMFEAMIAEIREETVRNCYSVTVHTDARRRQIIVSVTSRKDEFRGGSDSAAPAGPQMARGAMPQAAPEPQQARKPETYRREAPKVGRNDPCPCGSRKKYKNCCMKKDMENRQ